MWRNETNFKVAHPNMEHSDLLVLVFNVLSVSESTQAKHSFLFVNAAAAALITAVGALMPNLYGNINLAQIHEN